MTVDRGNGQNWHERVREGSIWPDPAGKRNFRTGWGHPDGFRDAKLAKKDYYFFIRCPDFYFLTAFRDYIGMADHGQPRLYKG